MIEILSIGDELLQGATLNTNAQFLARELFDAGHQIDGMHTAPDDKEKVMEILRNRKGLIIVTGGLGPTLDDSTKEFVCELLSDQLTFNQEVFDKLVNAYGERPSFKEQATIPSKARVIHNRIGSAPALIFDEGIILLPGVPREMERLWRGGVKDHVLASLHSSPKLHHRKLVLAHLPEEAVDPHLRTLQKEHPEVGFGIYPSYGILTVRVSGQEKHLDTIITKLIELFPSHVMSTTECTAEHALHRLLIKNKATLAVAESCTGGSLAARLTALPSASDYLLGGVVSYSNAAKMNLLGVSETTLKAQGAVSSETATEMLAGVFDRFDADYGISITGIAGPSGGTAEKPIGTVYVAIGKKGEEPHVVLVPRVSPHWTRGQIIHASATYALIELWRFIEHGVAP